ncbi:MAG: hypothetical protein KAQ99_07310 [Candidatus Aureabacteria bacterium]|nr:hypothetical protein [Candidatus Auribacterota bacterium]MCK5161365.1 hypothetical protein [Candidatus Auribacterota bacterium]
MKLGHLNSSKQDYGARVILFVFGIILVLLGIFQLIMVSFFGGILMVIVGICVILISVVFPLTKTK